MIRLFKEDDLSAIVDIWYEASLLVHGFLTESFLAEERDKLRDIFIPRSQTWVYEEEDEVVGFVSLVANEVGGLFVHSARQRRGVGRALMDKARSLHSVLELEVFEKNGQGRAFYAKYGFVPIGRKKEETTGEAVIRLRYEGRGSTLSKT